MSLSGNLGFVSLDEILRLLTRSEQQGSVDVNGEKVRGRIFVTKGGIALATTADDSSLRQHLIKSGLIDEVYMQTVEAGEATFAPLNEDGRLESLLREMTVESIYQMGLKGDSFEVREGQKTFYASPDAFELEHLLEDSRQRLNEWTEVSKTVSDLGASIAWIHDLGDREEVKIDRDGWRVLSHVGSESSVSSLADHLGTTEFWTARAAASLISKDLLEVASVEEETVAAEPEPEPAWAASEEPESADPNESWWEEPSSEDDSPEDNGLESGDTFEVAAESPSGFEAEPEEAVSDEVSGETPSDEEETSELAPAAPDSDSLIPSYSDVAPSEPAEVEEDTEAFLEKVFSELDSPDEEQATEEEGYGLLRRRRMGAIRDVAGDA